MSVFLFDVSQNCFLWQILVKILNINSLIFSPAVLELHADKWKDGRTEGRTVNAKLIGGNFLQNFTTNGSKSQQEPSVILEGTES